MNDQETKRDVVLYHAARKAAMKAMLIGIGLMVLGLALSFATFALSETVGIQVVFIGLILYGLAKALRGAWYVMFPKELVTSSEEDIEANQKKWEKTYGCIALGFLVLVLLIGFVFQYIPI